MAGHGDTFVIRPPAAESATASNSSSSSNTRQTRRSRRSSVTGNPATSEPAHCTDPAGDSGALEQQDSSSSSTGLRRTRSRTGRTQASSSSSASVPRSSRHNQNTPSLSSVSTDAGFPATPADAPSASGPSVRALGKRRAVSPPSSPSDGQTETPAQQEASSSRVNKRRRTSKASSASDSPSQSYNLRPRGSSFATTTAQSSPLARSTETAATSATVSRATGPSQSRTSMPRKGKAPASGSASGASGSRSGNGSLRAKATANAALAAANAQSSGSGRAAHANAQGTSSSSSSSRRQRDPAFDDDDEALMGIMDAREAMAIGDEDMHEEDEDGGDNDDDDEEGHAIGGPGGDDSMQLIGGASMDFHDEDEDAMHASRGPYADEDDEDDDDDIDEGDEIHGGEGDMLDEDFEAPLTFDADGNPIAAGAAGRPALQESMGAAGSSRGSASASTAATGGAAGSSAAARAALAAAVAAAGDDDFGSFAASLRGYPSGLMGGMTSRLRGLLQNLRSKDASVKMIALQELSEILSMSTEDTLAGYFSLDAFVKELISCLRGSAHAAAMDLEGLDEDDEYAMAQAIAAAADAADAGGVGDEGSEDEMQVLACRCLANLIEAMPIASHTIVAHGAVPVLCEKLLNITVIDLAEQTISTLGKLSEEMPHSIVREGGLAALLTYLDFFSIHVQRTALTAAARCCNRLGLENFDSVKETMPILKNVLSYADSKLVEQACLAITGVVESYRHHPDKLEILLTSDLLSAIAELLVPGQKSSVATVDPSTHPRILKLLSTAAKSSPEIAFSLIEADIVSTLYNLLTGISPPPEEEGLQGIKKHLEADDMLVLNNLVHRSKDVVQETLGLIHDLLPALPKDGIFDPKAHMHRSKSKVKKEEAAGPSMSLLSTSAPSTSSFPSQRATRRSRQNSGRATPNAAEDDSVAIKMEESTPALEDDIAQLSASLPQSTGWGIGSSKAGQPAGGSSLNGLLKTKEASQDRRVELFSPPGSAEYDERRKQVNRFFAMLLPILLDVYSASIGVQIRAKTFQNMLKIVFYCHKDSLPGILTIVPMASFLASCFSSRDQPSLVIDALQMTELLLTKVPDTYQYFFRREGVMHELEKMAAQPLITVKTKPSRRDKAAAAPQDSSTASTPGASTPDVSVSTPADDGGDFGDLGTRIAIAAGSTSALHKHNNPAEALLKDAITLRSMHIRKMLKQSSATDGSLKADSELNNIRSLVHKLREVSPETGSVPDEGVAISKATAALASLADLLTSGNVMSSFEMQESGLIGGLLQFATAGKGTTFTNQKRRAMITEAFLSGSDNTSSALGQLVKRLQEALGKTEVFDVMTALPSGGDSRQNPAAMLARQLKIRLTSSDDAGVPRTLANVVVSIHAIATFQALNDYLRPKIGKLLAAEERARASPLASPGRVPERLSGVLAAFAAATGMPASDLEGLSPNFANALSSSAPSSLAGPSRLRESTSSNTDRRRSSRLSARASTSNLQSAANEPVENATAGHNPSTSDSRAHAATTCDDDSEDDEGDELLGSDLEPPAATAEDRPVNFEVAADGSRVNASTPDGTRIQTPAPGGIEAGAASQAPAGRQSAPSRSGADTPSGQARTGATGRSYAAALKAAPSDWHLQFSMGSRPVSLDTTIFGACYQHEVRNANAAGARGIWHNVYTVNYKKVAGAPAATHANVTPETKSYESVLPDFLTKDVRQANILRLLSLLHQINSESIDLRNRQHDLNHLDSSIVPGNVFVNNKLTAKLNRQLEEPMIVASDCLPDWAVRLPQLFPFLFPFETRYTFLQSTSFGYARLLQRWLLGTRPDSNSRRDDNLSFLGRITRQKVRIARERLFESAFKVFEIYGSSKALVEVEYFDEVGTGLGPTLEFYSIVSKEFRRKDIGIWREGDSPAGSEYVSNSRGLFPSPVDFARLDPAEAEKRKSLFKTLGTVVAKAQMDSRIVDFPFSRVFMKLILNQPLPCNTASVRMVDPALAQSMEQLEQYVKARKEIEASASIDEGEKAEAIKNITVHDVTIEDLALDFTLPGYDIELVEGGRETAVTMDNLSDYLTAVAEWTLDKGIKDAVEHFKEGFSLVFPVGDLHTFEPEELVKLFGDEDEDWSFGTISEHIKADHGYALGSQTIVDLISIISQFDHGLRRKALSFMTGASRLPIGGFGGLNPPLTVVRKVPDDGAAPDSVLPSVMTCSNFLKLPEYSSKEVLEERLVKAIEEGAGAFHLS